MVRRMQQTVNKKHKRLAEMAAEINRLVGVTKEKDELRIENYEIGGFGIEFKQPAELV